MYKIFYYLRIIFLALVLGGLISSLFIATMALGDEQEVNAYQANRPIDADVSSYYTVLEHAPYIRIRRPLQPPVQVIKDYYIWTESDSAAADIWERVQTAEFLTALEEAIEQNRRDRERRRNALPPIEQPEE